VAQEVVRGVALSTGEAQADSGDGRAVQDDDGYVERAQTGSVTQ